MSDAPKRREKQKWAIEKPKLDNAIRLRGIYFIEPDEERTRSQSQERAQAEIRRSRAVSVSGASGRDVRPSGMTKIITSDWGVGARRGK